MRHVLLALLTSASLIGCAEPDEPPILASETGSQSGPAFPWLELVGSTGSVVEFGELRYFDVQSNGRILAVDRMSSLLHVVGLDGSHLTLGGTGRGPGELAMPGGLAALDDGSIVVFDAGNARITHWGPDGRIQGQIPVHPLLTEGLTAAGSSIFLTSRLQDESEIGPGYDLVLSRWRGSDPLPADSVNLLAGQLAWQVARSSDTLSCALPGWSRCGGDDLGTPEHGGGGGLRARSVRAGFSVPRRVPTHRP